MKQSQNAIQLEQIGIATLDENELHPEVADALSEGQNAGTISQLNDDERAAYKDQLQSTGWVATDLSTGQRGYGQNRYGALEDLVTREKETDDEETTTDSNE